MLSEENRLKKHAILLLIRMLFLLQFDTFAPQNGTSYQSSAPLLLIPDT